MHWRFTKKMRDTRVIEHGPTRSDQLKMPRLAPPCVARKPRPPNTFDTHGQLDRIDTLITPSNGFGSRLEQHRPKPRLKPLGLFGTPPCKQHLNSGPVAHKATHNHILSVVAVNLWHKPNGDPPHGRAEQSVILVCGGDKMRRAAKVGHGLC